MPAITWAVERSGLRAQLSRSAAFAEAWARYLAHEVQRARLHAEILSLKTVGSRLDAWLVLNESLPVRGLWSRVGHEIGVNPEALYREIAKRRRAPEQNVRRDAGGRGPA